MLYPLNRCTFVTVTSNNTPLPNICVKQFEKTEEHNSLSAGPFHANGPKNERNLVECVKSAPSGDLTKLEQSMDPMNTLWYKESAMGVLALSSKCIEEDPNQRSSMSKGS